MPSHPDKIETVAKDFRKNKELTAAGTVQVFHLIPYYGFIPEWNKHTTITFTKVLIYYYVNSKKKKNLLTISFPYIII